MDEWLPEDRLQLLIRDKVASEVFPSLSGKHILGSVCLPRLRREIGLNQNVAGRKVRKVCIHLVCVTGMALASRSNHQSKQT